MILALRSRSLFFSFAALSRYVISMRTQELEPGPWEQSNVDLGASMLAAVPPPLFGALVFGETTVTFFDSRGAHRAATVPRMRAEALCRIDDDGSRWLLGDASGALHIVLLEHESGRVRQVHVEPLGDAAVASALACVVVVVFFARLSRMRR